MEGEKILMSQRQLQRLEVMGLVEAGKITLKEGAEEIGMSYPQTKRIRKRVQEKGGQGLIHGNTGNPSNHRMKEGIKAKVYQFPPLFSLMKEVCTIKAILPPTEESLPRAPGLATPLCRV